MKLTRRNPLPSFAADAAEHYGAELHRFLARRMHRPQDIEDLVQEVYVRLLRINDSEFIRNPRAYILQTAAHVVHDWVSKNRRAQSYVVVDSEIVDHITENPTEPTTDQLAKRLSTQRQLNAALAKLDASYQVVLLMHYREGYTYEEIATRLKISVAKVERRLASAKLALMDIDWRWD